MRNSSTALASLSIGVGSEWQAGNIPEFLQQSFATRANASNGAAAAG